MLGSARFHFRFSGFLEGVSFLLLLGVAMPLKYFYDMPQAVRYTGMAHGLLFIWYVSAITLGKDALKLDRKEALIALAGSLLPFGTFYTDRRIFGKKQG